MGILGKEESYDFEVEADALLLLLFLKSLATLKKTIPGWKVDR